MFFQTFHKLINFSQSVGVYRFCQPFTEVNSFPIYTMGIVQ